MSIPNVKKKSGQLNSYLWGQYFCMIEMGYEIERLAFYAIATNKTFPLKIPNDDEKKKLIDFIEEFKEFDPETNITVNQNKCTHCIYCNLCDKTEVTNVYT